MVPGGWQGRTTGCTSSSVSEQGSGAHWQPGRQSALGQGLSYTQEPQQAQVVVVACWSGVRQPTLTVCPAVLVHGAGAQAQPVAQVLDMS